MYSEFHLDIHAKSTAHSLLKFLFLAFEKSFFDFFYFFEGERGIFSPPEFFSRLMNKADKKTVYGDSLRSGSFFGGKREK